MPAVLVRGAAALLVVSSILAPALAHAEGQRFELRLDPMSSGEPPPAQELAAPPCTADCWVLSDLSLRGAASGTMSFELHGMVRDRREQKIPLFGPPSQVRLDDVTIDGARATIGFDGDGYYLFTSSRSFTVRGRVTLGSDQMLSVHGPLVSFDAHLTKGRVVEGDKLSGLSNSVLHFDPMTDDEAGEAARPKTPAVFRLSRSVRFGSETTFVYRLVTSQSTDLGTVTLPLVLGEKVQDVQGSTGWKVEGGALLLPASGHDADITVSGSLPPASGPRSFKTDARSAYEWWLVEADPEHRIAFGGEAKLVETSQSPIPPTMPGAHVYLVQRGQELEVDARSLVRGDVLAAVARTHRRFVAITGRGELISDESIAFENNGLDHLMLTPAGKAMYLSTDAAPQRILHTEQGAADVLVPIRTGSHLLRVQSLSEVRISPLIGALAIPSSSFPLATSAAEITVGLPPGVHALAVLGGDRARWASSRGDLIAVALGIALAWFGFRDRKTRAIGALVTAGLWFVSREAFVVVSGGLFVVGAIFLASRFLRGNWLLAASGAVLVAALFTGRFALDSDVGVEPTLEMFAAHPAVPTPEASYAAALPDGSLDTKAGVTPVSLSIPTSDRYVQSSRQLVTRERPFVPRVFYVTSATIAILHVVWFGLLALLAWAHRDKLIAVKSRIVERLTRRPDALDAADVTPPF